MEAASSVGIDVSKARLDVALGAEAELFEVASDQRGIAVLIAGLSKIEFARVLVEATSASSPPLASSTTARVWRAGSSVR